ncbi:hypothetical protein P9112_002959 [Eukaryota sp. TZLM1-RC]
MPFSIADFICSTGLPHLLQSPIVLPCGHNHCRTCYDRSFNEYSKSKSLKSFCCNKVLIGQNHAVNAPLERILNSLPAKILEIHNTSLKITSQSGSTIASYQFLARYRGQDVLWQQFRLEDCFPHSLIADVQDTVDAMFVVYNAVFANCDHLLKVVGVTHNPPGIVYSTLHCTLQEWMDRRFVSEVNPRLSEIYNIIKQLVDIFQFIHNYTNNLGLVTPETIWLTLKDEKVVDVRLQLPEFFIWKIAQYGSADLYNNWGFVIYSPPEIFNNPLAQFSKASDIFVLGCIAFSLLSKTNPYTEYYDEPSEVVEAREVDGGASLFSSFADSIPYEYHSLIMSMMAINPFDRPHITLVVNELNKIDH